MAPGQQVEAAQASLVPPVLVVERDAPDEGPLLGRRGGCRRRSRGRRCSLLTAPSLEGQEVLVCLQGGLAGLLQLMVDEALVIQGLPRRVPGGARLLRGITVGGRVHGKA